MNLTTRPGVRPAIIAAEVCEPPSELSSAQWGDGMNYRTFWATAALCALVACGGGAGSSGGGGNGGGTPPPGPSSTSDVSVTVSQPTDPIPVGEVRWYDLVIANGGPDTATDVTVLTDRPLSFSPIQVLCEAAGGATCPPIPEFMDVPSLPAHGSLRYRVFVDHIERGAVTITTFVRATNDINRLNDSAAITMNAYSADLKVAASAPSGETAPGTVINYAMSVTNAGPDPAAHVVIHNLIDANQAVQGMTCTGAGGAVCPSQLGPAMKAPTMPVGGSLRFSVDALPWPTTIGQITNRMQVSALGDPHRSDNAAVATARIAIPSTLGSIVNFESDAADFVGQGQSHVYDRANSMLLFDVVGSRLTVRAIGDKDWSGTFQLPGGLTQLQPGTYLNLGEAQGTQVGGLSWSGDGRSCSSVAGWIIIDQVTYSGSTPTLVDMHFEQRCDGTTAGLRGRVRWVASDTTQPPPPISPPPADLWRAAPGALPTQGSYLHLRRAPYDPVLGRADMGLFTRTDSVMSVVANGRRLEIRVHGDETWAVDFTAMENLNQLQPGYYRGLTGNPARGRLTTSLQDCDAPSGWLAIDNITYDAGVLSSIDLRFEQHCGTNVSAFQGQLHWVANEAAQPPGPQTPPTNLWRPPAGSTPSSGNYVYLESDAGDYIGAGQTRLFTGSNSAISVTTAGINRRARVNVGDGMSWGGEFYAMTSVQRLEPGLYFGVLGAPTHNPARGGLSWSGDGRACNALWGWFVVDSVSYSGDELTSLEVRFEQHCEYAEPALRGQVHWAR
jgi:uncharacterized repeat protein (TIGR01451 family)